jgi:hypothetical protein
MNMKTAKTPILYSLLAMASIIFVGGCEKPVGKRYGPPVPKTSTDLEVPETWKDRAISFLSATPSTDRDGEERDIEEADIINHQGDHLFILNAYRGFQVLNVADPDEPELVGRVPIYGHPVEMYIRDSKAYVLVSDYFTYWRVMAEDGDDDIEGFHGSTLAIIDLSDPENPVLEDEIGIEGYVSETRRVGDVIYVVSNRYSWWNWHGSDDNVDLTFVMSVNVADTTNIHSVDEVSFEGTSYNFTLTTEFLFLAASDYDYDNGGYHTNVTLVDISDPAGDIAVRGVTDVPGYVQTKYHLNPRGNDLRVVSMDWNNQQTVLSVVDVENPDQPSVVGSETMGFGDQLFATRFDGDKAYVVTYERVDPLYVVDLSDRTNPEVVGELEVPGWSTHIEPRGDRLIALGIDDTENQRRTAISLFDVSEPSNPTLIERVPVGEGYSWSAANYDPKAFKILDDDGIILLPFQTWGEDPITGRWTYSGGLQLFSFTADDLEARGAVEQKGYVKRALPIGDRVMSVSDHVAFTLNIDDLDAPEVTAEVELARNIQDFVKVGPFGVMLVADWYSDDTKLRVAPLSTLDNVDDGVAIAEVELEMRAHSLMQNGNLVYVFGTDWQTYTSTIQIVDFSDPVGPVVRGNLELPFYAYYYRRYYGNYGYWYSYGGELVQVGGDVLVYNSPRWSWHCYYDYCDGEELEYNGLLQVIDLSDPDHPTMRDPIPVDRSMPQNPIAEGNKLRFTTWEGEGTIDDLPVGRYWLETIDFSDPANPHHSQDVNIPGTYLGSVETDEGRIGYTLDYQWVLPEEGEEAPDSCYYCWYQYLQMDIATVLLVDEYAVEGDDFQLDGGCGQVAVKNGVAYFTEQKWNYWWAEDADGEYNGPEFRLRSVDLRDPLNIELGSDFTQRGYGWLTAVDHKNLYFTTGWGGGLLIFNLENNPAEPEFDQFARTQGYTWRVIPMGPLAYIPGGMYGMQVLKLAQPNL